MSYVSQLKQRALDAEAERDFYRMLLEDFFDGSVPEMPVELLRRVLQQWGRRRLEEKKARPALLQCD